MDFRCNERGLDLCFNGGSCDAWNSTCSCPVDYGADFFFFHFPNCVQYSSSAYLIELIISTLFFFTITALYLQFIRKQKFKKWSAKLLGALTYILVVACECVIISLYLQNGCFEGCTIFWALIHVIFYYVGNRVIHVSLISLYKAQNQPSRKLEFFLSCWTFLGEILTTVTASFMLKYCRERKNLRLFNIPAFAFLFGNLFLCLLAQITFAFSSMILMNRLSNVIHADKIRRKLVFFRNASLFMALGITIFEVLIIFLFAFLGSFPYFFIISFIMYLGTVTFFALLIFVLTRTKSSPERKGEEVEESEEVEIDNSGNGIKKSSLGLKLKRLKWLKRPNFQLNLSKITEVTEHPTTAHRCEQQDVSSFVSFREFQ